MPVPRCVGTNEYLQMKFLLHGKSLQLVLVFNEERNSVVIDRMGPKTMPDVLKHFATENIVFPRLHMFI